MNKIDIDKIFIISYVGNSEKRKRISNYLINELGITDFEFIYGPDPNLLKLNNIPIYDRFLMSNPYTFKENFPDANIENGYYKHHISALIANINVWQISLAEGYNKILIIEDDATFMDDKEKIFKTLNNYPKDADIVHYGYRYVYDWQNGYVEKYDDLFSKTNVEIPGAQCYGIYNKETLIKLLDYQKNMLCVIDQFMQFMENINRYYANERICHD